MQADLDLEVLAGECLATTLAVITLVRQLRLGERFALGLNVNARIAEEVGLATSTSDKTLAAFRLAIDRIRAEASQ